MDLFAQIDQLKQTRKAVILAHYYQEPDIQDVADFIGDSLQLSQQAAKTDADVIVFAGVHFMAETAKILNPTKKVVIPDLNAGCSLADGCPADRFADFIGRYPDHKVVSYINCSAEVKALSDVICTSSNAAKIVDQLEGPVLFAPDQHLGRFVMRETGRDMVLWPGSCMVHEIFSEKEILKLKEQHPKAKVIAHPECEEQVLRHADFIGSTSALLQFVKSDGAETFIVATEEGILHQMRKGAPHKTLIPAPPDNGCACNQCPHMRLHTLEKLYLALRDLAPEVTVPEDVRVKALVPIQRMLQMS